MSLQIKRYKKREVECEAVGYNVKVPFDRSYVVCEHTLITNDELAPLDPATVSGDAKPVPGFGAIYRLIGDGTHAPTFAAAFKKSSGSGDYDSTNGVVNLVTFLFDGVDYWYSIVQAL